MGIYKQAIDCKYTVDRDLLILNTGHGLYKFKIDNGELRENVDDIASLVIKELRSIEEKQALSKDRLNHYGTLLLATLNICEKYTKLEKKYEGIKSTLDSMQTQNNLKRVKAISRTPSLPLQKPQNHQERQQDGPPNRFSETRNAQQFVRTSPAPVATEKQTVSDPHKQLELTQNTDNSRDHSPERNDRNILHRSHYQRFEEQNMAPQNVSTKQSSSPSFSDVPLADKGVQPSQESQNNEAYDSDKLQNEQQLQPASGATTASLPEKAAGENIEPNSEASGDTGKMAEPVDHAQDFSKVRDELSTDGPEIVEETIPEESDSHNTEEEDSGSGDSAASSIESDSYSEANLSENNEAAVFTKTLSATAGNNDLEESKDVVSDLTAPEQTPGNDDTVWQQAPKNPSHNDIFQTAAHEVEMSDGSQSTIAEVEDFQIVSDPHILQPQPEEADTSHYVHQDTSTSEQSADYVEQVTGFEQSSTSGDFAEETVIQEENCADSDYFTPPEPEGYAQSTYPVSQNGIEPQNDGSSSLPYSESCNTCLPIDTNIPEAVEYQSAPQGEQTYLQQDESSQDSYASQEEAQHSYTSYDNTVQPQYEGHPPMTPSFDSTPLPTSTMTGEESGYTGYQDTEGGSDCFYGTQDNNSSMQNDSDYANQWSAPDPHPVADDSSVYYDSQPVHNGDEFAAFPLVDSSAMDAGCYQWREERAGTDQAAEQNVYISESDDYRLPLLSFLRNTSCESEVDHNRIRSDAELLEKKLGYFGIKGEVMGIHPGPVITTYEYRPDPGIKISKIVNLADDLALALSAFSIRIVAPIPGKDVMGIEIPNLKKSLVPFIDVVTSEAFRLSTSKIPICLGKDIVGNPVVVELESMPHLLIAGATGTGKSVGLNAMITSILYKATPDEVRFLMIDPKRIELSFYNDIPHLLTPVITDMNKANTALQWMVREMDRRYNLLAEYQVRHIEQFNQKLRGAGEEQYDYNGELLEPMPYIVVIIDELADLMMTASRDIEFSLTRLAQMARAAGIHLILATQRPSVDVLTGIIKANFPTRISFQVSSKTDSRTIIDSNGAETLLGNGDMLFVPPGTARLTRVHGTYVSEDELVDITSFIKQQRKPDYIFDVLAEQDPGDMEFSGNQDEYDEKYNEALEFVMTTRQASISGVQRALRVGYNRAARIIDLMEKNGIVGPSDGIKPRKVLTNNLMM